MPLTPGYGETPVPDDELSALIPEVRVVLGEPITKAAIYDLEQAVQQDVAEARVTSIIDGVLTVDDLLVDHVVRELHGDLYGGIWAWWRSKTRQLRSRR